LASIKSEQFEAFLLRPPRGLKMALLHGPESDLVAERARRLVPTLVDDVADPFQVVRLSADTLNKDPGILADEASAISMFGGKRVLWIDAGGRDLSALIAGVADTLPPDTSIVVEADTLRKGAPLRTLFETRADAAAIECYAPPPASVGQMVDAEAKAAGVAIAPDVREHLVSVLMAEPATARTEIAKLLLYASDKGALDSADIDALTTGGGASPADALVDLALAGDLKGLERAVTHGLADSSDAALVAMRLAARIGLLLELKQGGEPERMHRLPFAVKRAVVAQANAMTAETLMRRLPSLLGLLVSTRAQPNLARAHAFRALLAFAVSARRGAG
jgi:DNA polymerase-3 subunit delta